MIIRVFFSQFRGKKLLKQRSRDASQLLKFFDMQLNENYFQKFSFNQNKQNQFDLKMNLIQCNVNFVNRFLNCCFALNLTILNQKKNLSKVFYCNVFYKNEYIV